MADQPVRFNPVGNMDKDSDPRYVRQGNYTDAKNIQKLTEKGGTGGAVIPTKGNEYAFQLGSVTAQSKIYRVNANNLSGSYQLTVYSMNRDHIISVIDIANGSSADIFVAIGASNFGNLCTLTEVPNEYVQIELNAYQYYDYTIESTGASEIDVYATQEAIPTNLAGNLKANGSFDLLGDLFITSARLDDEPYDSGLEILSVIDNGPLTRVTFSSSHDLQEGEWISIQGASELWLRGIFLVRNVVSSIEIDIITDAAWGVLHTSFVVGDALVYRNPVSIGEIGVAEYNQDADTWSYTRLLRSVKLNFILKYGNDITGRDDIKRKTLYYTDDYNNRRSFYYYGEYQEDGALSHVNSLNFYRYDTIYDQTVVSTNTPLVKISLEEQVAGGGIKAGNKRYFCYFVDFFGNQSAYSYLSNVVSAFVVSGNWAYGANADYDTGLSNRIKITGIDTSIYEYIVLGYVDYVEDAVAAYVLEETQVSGSEMIITHTGTEEFFSIDLAEITVSRLNNPKKAKNVDIVDNRLVFSNIKELPIGDIREWAKTFKHRIKEEWISERNSAQSSVQEYGDVQTIHNKLGYMLNETYRFGVQVRFVSTGRWSEAAYVDDIKIDPFSTNSASLDPTRRDQTGFGVIENFDLNRTVEPPGVTYNINPKDINLGSGSQPTRQHSKSAVKIIYPEFFGFDFNYEIEGVPLARLIDAIKIVRVKCIPEVTATGASILSVGIGGPPVETKAKMTTSNYQNGYDVILRQTRIGTVTAAETDLYSPSLPISYGHMEGNLYFPIAPYICLSKHSQDPQFEWNKFEGVFHEYPFAAGGPAQGGDRPFDVNVRFSDLEDFNVYYQATNEDAGVYSPWITYGFFGTESSLLSAGSGFDQVLWNINNSTNTATSNMKRCLYSDSVGVGGTPNYSHPITNYGYPDFQFRAAGSNNGSVQIFDFNEARPCPMYHYGEDANPPGDTGGFTGQHGEPFGTKVRLANRIASIDDQTIIGTVGDVLGDILLNVGQILLPGEAVGIIVNAVLDEVDWGMRAEPNTYNFYPFYANRRLLTFYSPDHLLSGAPTVSGQSKLYVYGEYRMDRDNDPEIANSIHQTGGNSFSLAGYSEYRATNLQNTFDVYDINEGVFIESGDIHQFDSKTSFRKGYSAEAKNWKNFPPGNATMNKPYRHYDNLYLNPGSLVLNVDGDSDSNLRNGVKGVVAPGKNTDYGVYYTAIYREIPNKYGQPDSSTYEDTGFVIKLSELTLDSQQQVERGQIKVFGGDTFTQSFYLLNRKPNAELKDASEGEEGENGGWAKDHIDQTPGWGAGIKFYSQNRVNAQLRTLKNVDADPNQIWADFYSTKNAWLGDADTNFQDRFVYNTSYTPKNEIITYASISDRLLAANTDYPSRIEYSEAYDPQTIDDKNQTFLPLSFKDIDQTFGEIMSHKNVNGELFTLQPRKFQAQYFNASGQLQTDTTNALNVVIGDGAVLARSGMSLSAYGTDHKWSVIKGRSPGGKDVLYWFNQESKLIMRFGADGTVVLSDAKGLRAFLENDARWTKGEDSPYVNQGVRAVWDDEYKEAIWTWRGYRASRGMWRDRGYRLDTYNVGDTVAHTTFINYPFEQIPDVYLCVQAHNPTELNEPGGTGPWESYWVRVPRDDGDYYSNFTLAFNEMTNGFSSFYSHMPKIYFPWNNKFLSAHPTDEQKIYEHRRGEYTTWYNTEAGELSEDAYIEGIVNYLPESSKKFVATQVISDYEPDRMEFKTLNQESFLNKGEFDDHDDHWRSPIKNDSTQSGDPSGDTKSLMGDFIKVKFFFTKKTYNRLYNFVVKLRERLRIYRS